MNLKVTFEPVDSRPDAVPGEFTADPSRPHYRFTVRRGRESYTGYITGPVGRTEPPTVADLMERLASDAAAYVNAPDLDDFAEEMGFDRPSTAMRAFRACKRTAEAFDRMGLDPFEDYSDVDA